MGFNLAFKGLKIKDILYSFRVDSTTTPLLPLKNSGCTSARDTVPQYVWCQVALLSVRIL
jgi:hypothetical protein